MSAQYQRAERRRKRQRRASRHERPGPRLLIVTQSHWIAAAAFRLQREGFNVSVGGYDEWTIDAGGGQ